MIRTGFESKWSNMDHLRFQADSKLPSTREFCCLLPHIPEISAKGSVALRMWLWQWLPVPKHISGCRKSRYLVRLGENSGLIFWLRFGATQCMSSPLTCTISRMFGSSCWQGLFPCAVIFAQQIHLALLTAACPLLKSSSWHASHYQCISLLHSTMGSLSWDRSSDTAEVRKYCCNCWILTCWLLPWGNWTQTGGVWWMSFLFSYIMHKDLKCGT